jgi:hypothetical protein
MERKETDIRNKKKTKSQSIKREQKEIKAKAEKADNKIVRGHQT